MNSFQMPTLSPEPPAPTVKNRKIGWVIAAILVLGLLVLAGMYSGLLSSSVIKSLQGNVATTTITGKLDTAQLLTGQHTLQFKGRTASGQIVQTSTTFTLGESTVPNPYGVNPTTVPNPYDVNPTTIPNPYDVSPTNIPNPYGVGPVPSISPVTSLSPSLAPSIQPASLSIILPDPSDTILKTSASMKVMADLMTSVSDSWTCEQWYLDDQPVPADSWVEGAAPDSSKAACN
jgi:hypothetical protein